jgi:hypothetical protein
MSHTAGPWIADNEPNVFGSISIRPSKPEFVSPNAPHGWSICHINGFEKIQVPVPPLCDGQTEYRFDEKGQALAERNMANARLIAAAPELLEALKSAVNYCNGYGATTKAEMIYELKSAIAKATGGDK